MQKVKGLVVVFLVMMFGLCLAQEGKARISVITDLSTSRIYIDGIFVGFDAVQNYQVDPGEHYVMVQYRKKKIFAKTYTLEAGQLKTIPTAHFVDFKTNVASRGAVDVEAARIRETRGNFAIGIQGSSSIGGISMKKWLGERLGVQGMAFISNEQDSAGNSVGTKYQSMGRLLVWIADKVVFDAPYSGYLFFGAGSDNLVDQENADNNVKRTITNGGFGVEFSPFGVNGLFMSLELGSESRKVYSYKDGRERNEAEMIGALGLHLYF